MNAPESRKSIMTIRSRGDLEHLNPYRRDGGRLSFRQIKLDIPDLPHPDLAAREERINRLFFDCGCAEATGLAIVALLAVFAWILFRPAGWSAVSWSDLGFVVVAFFVAAGVGKGIGRLRARYMLRRELAVLKRYFKDAESSESLLRVPCGVR
jgi:hypothetical protein